MKAAELKRIRGKMGKTAPEMAQLIGCGLRYYEYRESGTRPIGVMMANSVRLVAMGQGATTDRPSARNSG